MARSRDLWKSPPRRGHGKRWLAVWTAPDGREQTKAFAKRADADRHGAAMEADQLRGVYVDPRRGVMLARDYGELKFLPSLVHLRPNSASTYTSHLRTHWWPLLGDRQIRSLSRSDMKAAVAALAGSLAPSTVETVFAVMRAMMAAAVDDGVIPVNPCSRVPLPRGAARGRAAPGRRGARARRCPAVPLPRGRPTRGRCRAAVRRGHRADRAAGGLPAAAHPGGGAGAERGTGAAEDAGVSAHHPGR